MKRIVLGLLSTVLLLVMFTLGVYSQTDDAGETILARIQPLLVDIQQQVPVSVTLVIPEGATEGQTVTVPLVLDLNLQIKVADSVTVTVGETGAGITQNIENGEISARVLLAPARVRSAPTTDANIIATLPEDSRVVLKGITEDGVWVLIQVVDAPASQEGVEGWMAAQLLEITADDQQLSLLPIYPLQPVRNIVLPTVTPKPAPTSTPVTESEEAVEAQVDDLGIPFTFSGENVELMFWNTSDENDQFEAVGVLHNTTEDQRFSSVTVRLRVFDEAGKLLDRYDIGANPGRFVYPDETSRFDVYTEVDPEEIGSYSLEVKIHDWMEAD